MANNENVPQNANDQTIRVDNPLYLHSSYHSSLVLVTDLLTEHNYTSWSREYCVSNWCILWGKVQSRGQRFDKPDKSHLKCDHCGKRGHLKAGCFKLRGYPDWWPGANDMNLKSKGKFVANQVFMEEDQGTHMINNVMMTEDFGEDNPLALSQGMNAYENMQVLLNNLVHLGERLGHPSDIVIKHMMKVNDSQISNASESPCLVCPIAKQSRLLFPSSTSFSAEVFHLIHLDLWGPYKTKTMSGVAYFLTIVDDCSDQSIDDAVILPMQFWGDSILMATYLINTLPTALLSWTSPFEALYQKVPKVDHLKVFGSLCFFSNNFPARAKFDMRALLGVFLGYPMGQKAYKIFDLINRKVVVSRDLKFYEHLFPYSPLFPKSSIVPVEHPASHNHQDPLPVVLVNHEVDLPNFPPTVETHIEPMAQADIPCQLNNTQDHHDVPVVPSQPVLIPNDTIEPARHFLANISKVQEPYTYKQTIESQEWVEAMHKELSALEANDIWEVVDLPPNHKPIGCKWVFRLKYKQNGSVDKYKARLVAKGFNQIEGMDYFDSFSLVAKTVTVRIILAYVAANRWALHQLDINNAYLHGYLDEDIYICKFLKTILEGKNLRFAS
ncbi:transmembrane signal receptor [Lithospermum erythrorhizon]|uniref:Transmembrane signal receptor n=1 Tax=Lithospermum erythrorhizon TaxID=34254 RepID=A0AAV3P884_LITER